MSIFEQYGIKDIADVTLYSIHKKTDGSGEVYYVPALYMDSLLVSTVEKTGEVTWSLGGKGNSRLISWDHDKQINVSLTDALCTPASLGLCWSGVLSADWKNGKIDFNSEACVCLNPLSKVSRIEKAIYPRSGNDPSQHLVSKLLPQTGKEGFTIDLLKKSEVVDGTRILGVGSVYGHSYRWRLIVESGVRSVAQVPDRFFDIEGRSYPIDWNSKVSVFNGEAPTNSNFKDAIIYKIGDITENAKLKPYIIFDAWMDNVDNNGASVSASLQEYLTSYSENLSTNKIVESTGEDANKAYNCPPSKINETKLPITRAKYLAIVVDNNDVYHAYLAEASASAEINSMSDSSIQWYEPEKAINVNLFKGLDMWIRFEGINEMIYFMLTKYENDIMSINPSFRSTPDRENADAKVDEGTTVIEQYNKNTNENKETEGKLWAYVNPRTMKPYPDDYWFHLGEPYYIKSLTLAPSNKQIKGNRIVIKADQWPGMYMMIGETYIRERETGEDKRLQIKIPMCKVKSDQTITLEAGGDPTTFDLNLEVAKPRNNIMMEINSYDTATKMVRGENGCYYAVDGSSEVVSE